MDKALGRTNPHCQLQHSPPEVQRSTFVGARLLDVGVLKDECDALTGTDANAEHAIAGSA
jgi:hypothetical protein